MQKNSTNSKLVEGDRRPQHSPSDCSHTTYMYQTHFLIRGGGGGTSLLEGTGDVRSIGSRFHGWIDYNGVTFSVELLEWDPTFSGFSIVDLSSYRSQARTNQNARITWVII